MTEFALRETYQTAQTATQLPTPVGYKILCMVPKVEKTFGGTNLQKSDREVVIQEQTSLVLFVARLGPEAYKDNVKFPNGPWCKEGDFVITRAYSGTRLRIHGTEWRIINDDTVEGVVADPRGIERAG